jgi:hypothetical protein
VGLFDFLKGRRERESATHGLSTGLDPSQQVRAEGSGGPSAFDTTPPAQSGQAADVDWAQLAQIGPMIQRAIQSGNVQISHGEPQSIDLRGSGELRDQIMEIMRQHGIDPQAGTAQQFDVSQMPAMQQQILDALSQAGVDLGGVSSSGEDSPG